ncbi:hypothetical protein AZF37_08965 [endosymbiont 'TC1' of Trimyema compressum]|uniref:16S rRNA (guanine(527)-N(7))-methyltransferase RsmG n=1 Tax=endosymbiont 'TC1' of Trimyema compressum TaxID=243899 RepID=UPI0007F17EB7|nr:16S rRNA (guanine(527)-N(7))-methyltransferase RsmG [endosymbiont 'TC1' of Trimyema compressum]AMP21256.1 hypothetical protein AZF37_08965 [endosymbiont 'TC1' of Trimyema compressum]
MTIDTLKEYADLSEKQLYQFSQYYSLLTFYNKQFNLTAIRNQDETLIKHFVDSIIYSEMAMLKKGNRILDLGTGAGLPGIPFSILYPEKKILLVDSLNKKVNFLNTVIEKLNLKNTTVLHARGEALGRDENYRESFQIILARSVAYLPTLSEYLLPLVKVGSYCIVTKEAPYEEEVEKSKKAIKLLGGKIDIIRNYTLPVYNNERAIIYIKKEQKTPNIYPRKAGTPKKKPLF